MLSGETHGFDVGCILTVSTGNNVRIVLHTGIFDIVDRRVLIGCFEVETSLKLVREVRDWFCSFRRMFNQFML